ncbi:MAG: hypothetical protein AAB913_00655 [Patescibacteria group bacterium]
MISILIDEFNKSIDCKKFKESIYYYGCIFWLKRRNSQLEGKVVDVIPNVRFRGIEIPLYRFSPAWFSKYNLFVGIVPADRLIPRDVPTLAVNHSKLWLKYYKGEVVELNAHVPYKCVISNKNNLQKWNCVHISSTAFESHLFFVGLTKPELLII